MSRNPEAISEVVETVANDKVGLGVSIDYLVLEALYSISNYSYKVKPPLGDETFNERYCTISIYAGFKFE